MVVALHALEEFVAVNVVRHVVMAFALIIFPDRIWRSYVYWTHILELAAATFPLVH